jgi:tetratricopeptide (TPR) repeat protein
MIRSRQPFDAPEDGEGEGETEAILIPELKPDVIEMHRDIAFRLKREGRLAQAFTELVRACRLAPMTAQLAASLVHLALLSRAIGPARTLLKDALNDADRNEHRGIRRQLARLLRRAGDRESAREYLVELLAEVPGDRRARAALNAILVSEERWEELDVSLERATREALRLGALMRASKEASQRGRLWGEQRGDHSRAALRFMQASQYAEQSNHLESAYAYRKQWVVSLHRSKAPKRALDDAMKQTLALATRIGLEAPARTFVNDLSAPPRTMVSLEALTPVEAVPSVPLVNDVIGSSALKTTGVVPLEGGHANGDKKDASGVRRDLDRQVKEAATPQSRALALVLRAEEAIIRHEVSSARSDFEAAVLLIPLLSEAHAGLAELAAMRGDYAPVRQFEIVLAKVPWGTAGRAELLRRLARLADSPLQDAKMATRSWREVRLELPQDVEAAQRLRALIRTAEHEPTSPEAKVVPVQETVISVKAKSLASPVRGSEEPKTAAPSSRYPQETAGPGKTRWEIPWRAELAEDSVMEVASNEIQLEGEFGIDQPHHTEEIPVELGDPGAPIPASYFMSPSRVLSSEREELFERIQASPLESDGYRLLAEHFDATSDAARSSLMLEVARALEGDPHAAPRAPRLILSSTDRLGLKHASLRAEAGELVSLIGLALCKLFLGNDSRPQSQETFGLKSGLGARATADALLASVRILGLRAPPVFLSSETGPPIALAFRNSPRLAIGKQAAKKELPDATLRFFAGRALFTQMPELMALRNLKREQFLRGIAQVIQVASGQLVSPEAQFLRGLIEPAAWARLRGLVKALANRLDFGALSEGARHSANRAGLIVCGGVAPAIAALREKKALPDEMRELIRFASSERYLALRERVMPT